MKHTLITLIFIIQLFSVFSQDNQGLSCENAICLSAVNGGSFSNTQSSLNPEAEYPCLALENPLFFSFIPEFGDVTIELVLEDCEYELGLEATILSSNDCTNFVEYECISEGLNESFTLAFEGNQDQLYFLLIDGYDGDICDFVLTATGIRNDNAIQEDPIINQGESEIELCRGKDLILEVSNPQFDAFYQWKYDESINAEFFLKENGTLELRNVLEEEFEICAEVTNHCISRESCVKVEQYGPDQNLPEIIYTCRPEIDFCDTQDFFWELLEPNPNTMNWNLEFYLSFNDAWAGINQLTCLQFLNTEDNNVFFIKVINGDGCVTINDFEVVFLEDLEIGRYQNPLTSDLYSIPFFFDPGARINFNREISVMIFNNSNVVDVAFFNSLADAENGVNEINNDFFLSEGEYVYWLRREINEHCFMLDSFLVSVIESNLCEKAICLGDNNGQVFNNDVEFPTPPLSYSCGVSHDNIFFTLTALDSQLIFEIEKFSCIYGFGIQFILYEQTSCYQIEEKLCRNLVDGFPDNSPIIHFDGKVGQDYLVMIDGFSNDICDFTITATGIQENFSSDCNIDIDNAADTLRLSACSAQDTIVSIIGEAGCGGVFWSMEFGSEVISYQEDNNGIHIFAEQNGLAKICAKNSNSCEGGEACFWVRVEDYLEVNNVSNVLTCEQEIDLCDYQSLFDPPLYPDPDSLGWDLSFYDSRINAENADNPLDCDYNLSAGSQTLYLRIDNGSNCPLIESFDVEYEDVSIVFIIEDTICESSVDLSTSFIPINNSGAAFSTVGYYRTFSDAENDLNEMIPAIADQDGYYYVRISAGSCYSIDSFYLELPAIANPENWDIVIDDFSGAYYTNVSISGSDAPYTYEWSNGISGSRLNRVSYGDIYTLTVTNAFNCQNQITIPIIYSEDFDACAAVSVVPSVFSAPARLEIQGPTIWQQVELRGINGNVEYVQSLDSTQSIDIPNLMPGVYYLLLGNNQLTCDLRLLIL